MQKITYRAGEGDPTITTWRGRTFVKDQPIDLDEGNPFDLDLINAAKLNPSFDIGGESKSDLRAQAARQGDVSLAKARMADIQNQRNAIMARQDDEQETLDRKHKQERADFDSANSPIMKSLDDVIKGDDGSQSATAFTPPPAPVPSDAMPVQVKDTSTASPKTPPPQPADRAR